MIAADTRPGITPAAALIEIYEVFQIRVKPDLAKSGVEIRGLEPLASSVRLTRSPS